MAKSDKVCNDREMKNYVPPKGDKKRKKKDPNDQERPLSAFFCFAPNSAQRSKVNTLSCLLEKLQRNWLRCGLRKLLKISNNMSRKQLN